MARIQLTPEQFLQAVEDVKSQLFRCIERKGPGACCSQHEILGILHEEFTEYEDEVKANDRVNGAKELLDIAVGAIFGYASIKADALDW